MESSGTHDRGEAVAREIGRRLRDVRVAGGETLEAIAKRMLIKPGHLEALEAGELDRLPSRHHAAGYARAYAKQLGLDGDELGCPLLALSGWPPPEPDQRQLHRGWRLAEPLLCRPRQAAAALVAIVALGSAGWSVRHVGHGQHAAATVAIASAVMAPLPASSAAKADVPDSPATVEPPAAPHAEERLADTARAVAGRPAEPAAGEGQLADASVNRADTPLSAEAGREAAVDRPAKAGAEPAPAAGPAPAGATAVQLEASGPGAAPRRTSGRFSVQVASVRDRAAIPALWASLAGHQRGLTDLEPQAPQAVTLPGRGTFYRVLAGSFAARSDAQAACDRLRSSGTRCVVVAS